MSASPSGNGIEPLIPILKSQIVPCWERFGTDRLIVTAKTLKQFKRRPLPDSIRTTVKKRAGKKVTMRSLRHFNNTRTFVASWPEDDQAIFRYPALVFVLNGQADFHVADYVIHCPRGHFLLFATGVPRPTGNKYSHVENKSRRCDLLWLFVPPGAASVTAYLCHCDGEKHWHDAYRVWHRPEAIFLFKFLVGELEENNAGYQKVIRFGFSTFLHLLLCELEEGNFYRTGESLLKQTEENAASPIEQAQQYIKTHLKRSPTAAEVAAQVYMSRTSFLQRFSRETGQTFHDYITHERMETAQELLNQSDWSIANICNSIGLQPTQFRVQFKKHFGVSPARFRQISREKNKTVV